ncbi:MAG: tRNA pseudouridine(55) synthase TruB [Anaerolineae bacterium]
MDRVRSLTGIRRVGHAGTLDPLATGVLVVCIGRLATRVAEYLKGEPKTYWVEAFLGIATDTFDAEGEVVSRRPVGVDRDAVERALQGYLGSIEQIPPMYSAVKHKGKPLHRLARQGLEVEREPRPVDVHSLKLISWYPPRCALVMSCSAGTYVRVLVHELGQELGCGAHVSGLRRLASGSFQLRDAVTLDAFAEAARAGRWQDLLHSVDGVLANRFPALRIGGAAARQLCSGQPVRGDGAAIEGTELARVYGPEGRLLGLAAYDAVREVWRPRKVFVSPWPGPGRGDRNGA